MVPAVLVTMNEAPSLGIASIEIVNRKGIRNTAGGSISPEGARGAATFRRSNLCCGSLESAALNELVAQLVEQRPFKAWVVRSSRTELTTSFESRGRYRARNFTSDSPVIPTALRLRAA